MNTSSHPVDTSSQQMINLGVRLELPKYSHQRAAFLSNLVKIMTNGNTAMMKGELIRSVEYYESVVSEMNKVIINWTKPVHASEIGDRSNYYLGLGKACLEEIVTKQKQINSVIELGTSLANSHHSTQGMIISILNEAQIFHTDGFFEAVDEIGKRGDGSGDVPSILEEISGTEMKSITPFRTGGGGGDDHDEAPASGGNHLFFDEETLNVIETRLIDILDDNILRNLFVGREMARTLACILYGPPGTGKTSLALAIAKRRKAKCYRMLVSKIITSFVGEGEKAVEQFFAWATKHMDTNACVIIDEADSILVSRSSSGSASAGGFMSRIVNEFLKGFDAMNRVSASLPQCNLVLFFTTNTVHSIDNAFLERRCKTIFIDYPKEIETARRIYNHYIRKYRLNVIAQQYSYHDQIQLDDPLSMKLSKLPDGITYPRPAFVEKAIEIEYNRQLLFLKKAIENRKVQVKDVIIIPHNKQQPLYTIKGDENFEGKCSVIVPNNGKNIDFNTVESLQPIIFPFTYHEHLWNSILSIEMNVSTNT